MNNQHLHKAIGILGAKMPREKVFRTRLLDELYKETPKKVSEEIQEMLDEKVNLLACLYLCGEKIRR